MQRYILLLLFLVSGENGWSQTLSIPDSQKVNGTLRELIPSKTPTPVYVNFDVLKFTIGNGFSPNHFENHPYSTSWNFQFLWPFAFFRNNNISIMGKNIFLAVGPRIGRHRMAWKETELTFDHRTLISIQENVAFGKTVQRTGFLGLAVLPFMQFGEFKQITVMFGPAIDYNIKGKMRLRRDGHKSILNTSSQIKKYSVPLLFKGSYMFNRSKTLSIGVYGSYDFQSPFKGEAGTSIKQAVAGISGAIIL